MVSLGDRPDVRKAPAGQEPGDHPGVMVVGERAMGEEHDEPQDDPGRQDEAEPPERRVWPGRERFVDHRRGSTSCADPV